MGKGKHPVLMLSAVLALYYVFLYPIVAADVGGILDPFLGSLGATVSQIVVALVSFGIPIWLLMRFGKKKVPGI